MFGDHFYNKSIRNTTIAFGSLFNKLKVSRTNSSGTEIKQIQVPLSYGNKAKFIRRLREEYSLSNDVEVSMTLPRIGFELNSVEYDVSRKTNTLNRILANNSTTGSTASLKTNYSAVPYNLNFGLYILTETIDDGLQILEQITPYFTPEFTVTLNLVTDLYQKIDVPIILNSSSVESETEGPMSTSDLRSVMWTLDFTAKSYMYSPVKTGDVIKKTITVLYDATVDDRVFSGETGAMSRIDIEPNPIGATYGSDYDYTETLRVYGFTGADGIDTAGNTLA